MHSAFSGSSQPLGYHSLFVMAGLRPGHPRLSCFRATKDVDARDKPGHDEFSAVSFRQRSRCSLTETRSFDSTELIARVILSFTGGWGGSTFSVPMDFEPRGRSAKMPAAFYCDQVIRDGHRRYHRDAHGQKPSATRLAARMR
jgi:hypothetical protein